MAKKAAAKKAATKKTAKKAPKKAAKAKPAKKAAPAAKPTLGEHAVGHAAGAVWVLLHENGPQTLAAIKKGLDDTPSEVALMGVGWLAREGKLDFIAKGRSIKIGLR